MHMRAAQMRLYMCTLANADPHTECTQSAQARTVLA